MIKPQSLKRPLFLMGLPGCGKSTLGRALRGIGFEFTDLDEAVELRCGMSVADVIQRNGIDHFRRLEASELQRLIDSDKPQIIACGGGTPCHADNMERMNRAGLTVRLECCRERLVRRLAEAGGIRPMFADIAADNEAIDRKISKLQADREPFYSQAAVSFDSSMLETREEIDATVAKFISRFGGK